MVCDTGCLSLLPNIFFICCICYIAYINPKISRLLYNVLTGTGMPSIIERKDFMRLNQDCVREALLFIEENVTYGTYADFSKVDLGNYSRNDIIYSADKLLEAGFIEGTKIKTIGSGPPGIRITAITWSGHQFLDNIRDNKVWKHTKSIVKDFSSVSLSTILNVSSQVISLLIKDKMNLF